MRVCRWGIRDYITDSLLVVSCLVCLPSVDAALSQNSHNHALRRFFADIDIPQQLLAPFNLIVRLFLLGLLGEPLL